MNITQLHSDYDALASVLSLIPLATSESIFRESLAIAADLQIDGDGEPLEVVLADGTVLIAQGGRLAFAAALPADPEGPCPACVRSRHELFCAAYPGQDSETFDARRALALAAALARAHRIPFALTGAYEPQNWSVVMPLPYCSGCSDRTRRSFPDWLGSRRPLSRAEDRHGTGGPRSLSAEGFIANNRAAIGFASVLGNPVPVRGLDVEGMHLVNAPVFMLGAHSNLEVAGGKGESQAQAIASCLGEGLERYALAGVYRREQARFASRRDLQTTRQPCVDPSASFGFPSRDLHPTIEKYTDDVAIEWVTASESPQGRDVLVPANLIFCPYMPAPGAATIAVASTNGAAAGATEADAVRQAMLEVVERDAFWFYARSGASPTRVPLDEVPPDVALMTAVPDLKFTVELLPNPYRVPVAQVVVTSTRSGGTRTARGTGAHLTISAAIRRATIECLQMYASLSTGLLVEPTDTDMRHIWFTGESQRIWPLFFRPVTAYDPALFDDFASSDELIDGIRQSATAHAEHWWTHILVQNPSITVVKAMQTDVSVVDATYFENNDRLRVFAERTNTRYSGVAYQGPLFM